MRISGGDSTPFLVAPPDSICSDGWFLEQGDVLPSILPDWDPATNLNLYRDMSLETEVISRACALRPGSSARVGVTWTSSARLSTVVSGPLVQLDGETQTVQLAVTVPGREVAGKLQLRTFVWVEDPLPESGLSPKSEGDLIWSDRQSVVLESDAARFPVNVIDFEKAFLDPRASWYLDWPTRRFDEPFLASLRLLINSRKSEVVEAVKSDSESEAAEAIRRHILLDTARTLIEFGLGSEEFHEDYSQFPEGTVGHAISELITTCWGSGVSPSDVRRVREEMPQAFDCQLQAMLMEAG